MKKIHLEMIKDVEFSNDNSQLLHKNDGENGLTYYGIYESAHPDWKGWNIIKRYYANIPNLVACSQVLANVSDLEKLVIDFYKKEFWDKLKLDSIKSEKKQLEILCFAINVGVNRCIRKTQKLVGVEDDGIIGNRTIEAINLYNESLFDKLFDDMEISYYDSLDEKRFGIYKKGWKNRALKY